MSIWYNVETLFKFSFLSFSYFDWRPAVCLVSVCVTVHSVHIFNKLHHSSTTLDGLLDLECLSLMTPGASVFGCLLWKNTNFSPFFFLFSLFISSFFLSSSPFSFLGPKYSSSRTHSTRLSLSQHLFISYDELPESVGGRAIETENLEKFSARQKFFGLFRCLPLVDASPLFPSRTKTVLFSIESVGSGTISFSFLSFSKKPRTLYQDRHQRQTKTLINTFLPSDFWLVQSIEKPIESSVWHFYLPFGVMSTTRKDMRTG